MYIPDFFREFRTLNPALREFRTLDPEVRNGVWDSGIPDFFPDLVHLWKYLHYSFCSLLAWNREVLDAGLFVANAVLTRFFADFDVERSLRAERSFGAFDERCLDTEQLVFEDT